MTAGVTAYPDRIDDETSLLARREAATTLAVPIAPDDAELHVAIAVRFQPGDVLTIEGEHIACATRTATTLSGCVRGLFQADGGRPPSPHEAGAIVAQIATARHHRAHTAAIVALERKLGAGGTTPAAGTALICRDDGITTWGAPPIGPTGPRGVSGVDGRHGEPGIAGESGPQGPEGPTGPKGDTGPKGAKGDRGAAGPPGMASGFGGGGGSRGPQGAQGPTGPAGGGDGGSGATGPTGAAGPSGAQGAQGSAGTAGAQGATGVTGPQGAQGTQGVQGVQGSQGAQGVTGSTGPQGTQGVQGSQGAQGSVGAQGSQGATGATGSQGAQGTQGVAGAQGAQGSQGSTGPTGPQGAQGTQGSVGAQGSQGAQGTQGVVGATGPTGPQGAQGFQGTQGAQGATGATGPTGAASTVAGPQGTQGPQGAQGTQGSQGVTGPTGPYGGAATLFYTFKTATADATPGSGNLRLNNATQNAATTLRISTTDALGGSESGLLQSIGSITSAFMADIKIQHRTDPTKYLQFGVTSEIGGDFPVTYYNITGQILGYSAASPFADGDPVLVMIDFNGQKGDTGAQGAQGAQGAAPAVAGSTTQVIFNDAGAYAGDAGMTYAKATDILTVGSLIGLLRPPAGTATAATEPLQLTSGTLLTTPEPGAFEFDGVTLYFTDDATSGRAASSDTQIFRLPSDSGTIGGTIADAFGTTSAFPHAAGGIYLIEWFLFYLKTTAATVTYTITSTQTPVNINAWYVQSPAAGISANAGTTEAGANKSTSTALALPATASLTNGADHQAVVTAIYEANASNAGNVRMRVTCGSGTLTMRRDSFYRVRRLPAGNSGTFVA